MQWIRGKIQERKDKESETRSRTPDRHRARSSIQVSNDALPVRGKSFEQQTRDPIIPAPTVAANSDSPLMESATASASATSAPAPAWTAASTPAPAVPSESSAIRPTTAINGVEDNKTSGGA